MKPILSLMCIFILSLMCFGQKTVADLQSKHAIALEDFLSKNKNYGFLSEKVISEDNLKEMRKYNGKNLQPFYRVGDFNRDRVTDFALILSRKGEAKFLGEGFAEGYELSLIHI